MVQLLQRRRLLNTWRTLAPPEVQQHHLAPVVRQVNSVLAVADRKVRGDFVRIGRTCPSIAPARKRKREKGTSSDETRKPHIHIIRSDSY